MLSQTNTMTMGGGQITQNVVPTSTTNVNNGPRIGLMVVISKYVLFNYCFKISYI